MSLNALKKTVIFSSQAGKDLIAAMIADDAAVTGRTVSAALEYRLLYDPLLPQDKTAAFWLQRMYSGHETAGPVISDYAAYISALPERYLDTAAFLSLVWFCRTYCLPVARFVDQHEVAYLQAQVSSVTEYMRDAAAASEDTAASLLMLKEVDRIEKEASAALEMLTLDVMYVYEVFSAYPDAVCGCGRTYRLISWIARHCEWEDSAKARYDVVRLMKDPAADMTPCLG